MAAGEVTPDKVSIGFVVLTTAGQRGLRGEALLEAMTGMMADSIAALLKDETGNVRQKMLTEFEKLWALYGEHDPTSNPWDLGSG